MRDVRPLPDRRSRVLPPETITPPVPGVLGPIRPDRRPALRQVDAGPETWGYLANDAGPPMLRELRSGARPPTASLDLHGFTGEEASRALEAFILESQASGQRSVLIIHGRGRRSGPAGPVLGPMVRERLASGAAASRILALSHAPSALGGAGATLVLLRKR